ncbi:hypothetical protein [Pontibacter arcticus]|uniref:Phosphoribosylpyrophosphate synthetase n=1 Tax=Pontibacter arcticus TaxID=2080288 RepID=A0A364RIK7_9BACT|nr:hypothetical protein [Pontibacter arcticus]RAU84105.1 hypothetical protein DP923_03385 [Pontibacter arcticus]
MPSYSTLQEAIAALREQGFTHTFIIQNKQIFCPDREQTINPEQLTLLERHPIADPQLGQRELYGFRTHDGALALMTNTYAEYEPEVFENIFSRCVHHTTRRA